MAPVDLQQNETWAQLGRVRGSEGAHGVGAADPQKDILGIKILRYGNTTTTSPEDDMYCYDMCKKSALDVC